MQNSTEYVNINANYMTVYEKYDRSNINSLETHKDNFSDNFHDCTMSASAIKTIKKCTNVILYIARKKHFAEVYKKPSGVPCTSSDMNDINNFAKEVANKKHLCTFLTLTLPAKQTHSDKDLTRFALNPFLSYAKKVWWVKYFCWKKELQVNGNVHYHLIFDKYIDAFALRREWNKILNRGIVQGCKVKFDYVDRFRKNQLEKYKDGFDEDKIFDELLTDQSIKERTEDDINKIIAITKRDVPNAKRRQIHLQNVQKAFEKVKDNYNTEMLKKPEQRWTNPNSTDIKSVKTSKAVACYVAKYISKEVDNDIVTTYQKQVESKKEEINKVMRNLKKAKEKKDLSEVAEMLENQLADLKKELSEIREKCPISGRLWFKSASLTSFTKGASANVDYELSEEIKKLIEYLEEKKTKKGVDYVFCKYAKNDDGSDNTEKIICVTMLENVFDILTHRDKETNKLLFPLLARQWKQFFFECLHENNKKGLYDIDFDNKKQNC